MEPKKKNKRGRWIVFAVVTVVVAAVVVLVVIPFIDRFKEGRQAFAAATAEPGQTVTAFIGDLASGATASGRLLPQQEAQLALGVAGQVETVYVHAGDEVQTGDGA